MKHQTNTVKQNVHKIELNIHMNKYTFLNTQKFGVWLVAGVVLLGEFGPMISVFLYEYEYLSGTVLYRELTLQYSDWTVTFFQVNTV